MFNIFGMDAHRDQDTLFLTVALELGRPRPIDELRVRLVGKKAPIHCEPDIAYVTRFSQRANSLGVSCVDAKQFEALYQRYIEWYARNHPDV